MARAAHYFDDVMADGAGKIDQRRGIRLGEPEVEVLSVFKERMRSQESHNGGDHSDLLSLALEKDQPVSHREALADASGLSSKKKQEEREPVWVSHDVLAADEHVN